MKLPSTEEEIVRELQRVFLIAKSVQRDKSGLISGFYKPKLQRCKLMWDETNSDLKIKILQKKEINCDNEFKNFLEQNFQIELKAKLWKLKLIEFINKVKFFKLFEKEKIETSKKNVIKR